MSAPTPSPEAEVRAEEQRSGAQTGGASAGGGSEARVAAAGAAADVGMDIGQTEADTTQLRRLISEALGGDTDLRKSLIRMVESTANLREKLDSAHADQVRALNGAHADHVRGLNGPAQSEREATVRDGRVASDRTWTQINEIEANQAGATARNVETSNRTADVAWAAINGYEAALRRLGVALEKPSS